MNKEKITQAFTDLANNYVATQMENIYRAIYKEVREASPEVLASKITSLESRSVNNFCMKLDDKAGQTAREVMQAIGVPEARIPMIWVKVRNELKAPHVRTCNQQNYEMPSKSSAKPAAKPAAKSPDSKPSAPPVGKYSFLILGGVAVEVISWVFLPASSLWAPIIKGIGILMIAVGGYQMIKDMSAAPRITLTEEAVKAAKTESAKAIQDICWQQRDLNTKIFTQWLEDLSDKLAAECANHVE